MKNILLPTDFSACAKNATYAALELAAAYRAKLHLYTNISAPKNWNSFTPEDEVKFPEVLQKIQLFFNYTIRSTVYKIGTIVVLAFPFFFTKFIILNFK